MAANPDPDTKKVPESSHEGVEPGAKTSDATSLGDNSGYLLLYKYPISTSESPQRGQLALAHYEDTKKSPRVLITLSASEQKNTFQELNNIAITSLKERELLWQISTRKDAAGDCGIADDNNRGYLVTKLDDKEQFTEGGFKYTRSFFIHDESNKEPPEQQPEVPTYNTKETWLVVFSGNECGVAYFSDGKKIAKNARPEKWSILRAPPKPEMKTPWENQFFSAETNGELKFAACVDEPLEITAKRYQDQVGLAKDGALALKIFKDVPTSQPLIQWQDKVWTSAFYCTLARPSTDTSTDGTTPTQPNAVGGGHEGSSQ